MMLTHRSLSTSVAQQVDGDNPNIGFTADDVILCSLPMFHIYSLNTIMMCGLRVGAAIVVMRRFDLARMMQLVERHRITIAPLVPPIVVAVAKSDEAASHDLSSVRMVLSGAAPMGKDIEDAFMAKLPGAVLGQVRAVPCHARPRAPNATGRFSPFSCLLVSFGLYFFLLCLHFWILRRVLCAVS